MKRPAVRLGAKRRAAVEKGVKNACLRRRWQLWAVNARTNHGHAVVTANCHSKKVRSTLKAYATRNMRKEGCWNSGKSPWAAQGSRISLWDEDDRNAATVYVLYDQGEPLPDNDDD